MKILIMWPQLPPFAPSNDHRVSNSVKYLSKKYKHNITIAAFKHLKGGGPKQYDYLKEYCDEIETVDIPTSLFNRLIYHVANNCMGIPSRKMQRKINKLLSTKEFDVIFTSNAMIAYVADENLPKVSEIWEMSRVDFDRFKLERKIHKRLYDLMLYFRDKNYEKYYENFDVCITPTEHERDLLKAYMPDLEISVIPYGVNVESTNKDFFVEDFSEDFPSLIFLGNFGSFFNQRSILYFYKEIYPLIKETFPEVKSYIVGKNPPKGILKLAVDNSVIVTGYVEDLRPYLACASVVTLPVHGYGIKTRILEAMAIGKPVVTSSEGIHGIDVTPEENIIIADDPRDFAERVIKLLNNEELRNRIGANARKLMEEEYSWEKMTDKLNEVLQKAVSRFHEK